MLKDTISPFNGPATVIPIPQGQTSETNFNDYSIGFGTDSETETNRTSSEFGKNNANHFFENDEESENNATPTYKKILTQLSAFALTILATIVTLVVILLRTITSILAGMFISIFTALKTLIGCTFWAYGGMEYAKTKGFFHEDDLDYAFAWITLPLSAVDSNIETYQNIRDLKNPEAILSTISSTVLLLTTLLLIIFPLPGWATTLILISVICGTLLPSDTTHSEQATQQPKTPTIIGFISFVVISGIIFALPKILIIFTLAIFFISIVSIIHNIFEPWNAASLKNTNSLKYWSKENTILIATILIIGLAVILLIVFPPASLLSLITTITTYFSITHLASISMGFVFAGITTLITLGITLFAWVVKTPITNPDAPSVETSDMPTSSYTSYRIAIITLAIFLTTATTLLLLLFPPAWLTVFIATATLALNIANFGIIFSATIALTITAIITFAGFGISMYIEHARDNYRLPREKPSIRQQDYFKKSDNPMIHEVPVLKDILDTHTPHKLVHFENLLGTLNNMEELNPQNTKSTVDVAYQSLHGMTHITIFKETWDDFLVKNKSDDSTNDSITVYVKTLDSDPNHTNQPL